MPTLFPSSPVLSSAFSVELLGQPAGLAVYADGRLVRDLHLLLVLKNSTWGTLQLEAQAVSQVGPAAGVPVKALFQFNQPLPDAICRWQLQPPVELQADEGVRKLLHSAARFTCSEKDANRVVRAGAQGPYRQECLCGAFMAGLLIDGFGSLPDLRPDAMPEEFHIPGWETPFAPDWYRGRRIARVVARKVSKVLHIPDAWMAGW